MDWGQCIVCQKKTSEALKCPLKAEGSGDKSGAYVSFMANVNEFKRLKKCQYHSVWEKMEMLMS